MLVFDLDPGEGVVWDFVIETALRLRRMLQDEGLEPWPKLTGGEGLHLMRRSSRTSTTTRCEPTPSGSRSASPRLHRSGTQSPQRQESVLGASSSIRRLRQRPRRDSDCGPGALAPGRERDPFRRLFYPEAAGHMRWPRADQQPTSDRPRCRLIR